MKKPSQANNGNIAETHWRSAYDHLKRGYAYKYDNLNRLKEAHYLRGGFFNNSYNEFVDYDKNGNITSLYRTGMVEDGSNPMVIDQLTYTYANNGLSNKLMKVTDAPNANRDYGFKDDSDGTNDIEDDYSYDTYGNMTSDQNKGILLIDYNHLNLPTRIRFNNGYQIEYLYNAAGVKLAKTVIEQTTTTTVYMNGYQYIDDKLQFFPQAEGYVKFTEGNNNQEFFNYIYQYKDHLGNNRVSYTIDPSDNVLKILTHDHYYPFGMKHQGYSNFVSDVRPPPGLATLMVMDVNDLAYKYKYNGKELQDELGLEWYDYHARNYDPAIGRWMNVDPHAENYFSLSTYIYAANNPLIFNDPDGKDILFYVWEKNAKEEWVSKQVSFKQLDAGLQKALESFAKTDVGYKFFEGFAKKGDKIGEVEFNKNGKDSKHHLTIGQFHDYGAPLGSAGVREGKDNIVFDMKLNLKRGEDFNNLESLTITIGHEAFLHMNVYKDNLINAHDRGDKAEVKNIIDKARQEGRDRGKQDHKGYLQFNPIYSKFNTFITQLKSILNPSKVNEAKKRHDEKLKKTTN